jgi:hypothetical protein
LRDFRRAQEEIAADIKSLSVWTPILHSYAGGLLEVCRQQISFSQDVVAGWLERHMLSYEDAGIPATERAAVARAIAGRFGSEEAFDQLREHGRAIRLEELEAIDGLRVHRLEDDDDLQDAVLSIFHAFDLTVGSRPVSKIVENHHGKRFVKINAQVIIQGVPAPAPPQQPAGGRPPKPGPLIPEPPRPTRTKPSSTKRRGRR